MKKLITTCFVCLTFFVSAQKLPFQGRLLDNGSPFNGTATIDFSIDTPPWSETISNVTVQDGYYSVVLGETNPLPDTLFSDSREVLLNLTVNGEVLSAVTLYSPLLPHLSNGILDTDSVESKSVRVLSPTGEIKADLNYFEPNDAGSVVLYGRNDTRNIILGSSGLTGGDTGFLGLYDTNDQSKITIRVDTLPGGGQDYGRIALFNSDFTKSLVLDGSRSAMKADTLETLEISVNGESSNEKVTIGSENAGYDALTVWKDSLNQTGAFLTTNRATGTGGYLQLNGRDFNDGTLESAVAIGTITSGRQNSFMSLYGGNSTADGPQLLVNTYASDIDLDGDIPDGYRRGGIDINNYFGNPTHNIFSEHIGTSTISHMNLNASTDGGGPVFTANINSGDAATTGASLNLSNFDGSAGVYADGTNGGSVSVGENRAALLGDLNSTGAGGLEMFDGTGTLRILLDGNSGNVSVNRQSDSGSAANIFVSSDNGGIAIQNAADANKFFYEASAGTLQLRDDSSIDQIVLDGNLGNISANGNISGNTLTSSDGTVQTSDRRLKKNVADLENPLEKTLQMRGVTYQWKDETKSQRQQVGVIAQEVEAVYPEFVHTDAQGMKAVNYAQMTAVLIEAIKALNEKVEQLESENATLKASLSEVETLRKEVNQLMKVLGSSKAASK